MFADIITNVAGAADLASSKSDRWLFIAAILFMVVGFVIAIRYLVKKNETMIESHHTILQKIAGDQNETQLKLVVILDRNSSALNDCTEEMRYCRERR